MLAILYTRATHCQLLSQDGVLGAAPKRLSHARTSRQATSHAKLAETVVTCAANYLGSVSYAKSISRAPMP